VTAGEPIRVLLAEDDGEVRAALGDLIHDAETLRLVAAVGDGEQAVQVAAVELPDVAVVDVRMPGMGGADATAGIKRVSPSTRVLALSAFDDRATVLEMLEAGAVGYLIKGVAAGRIVESIEAAAEGRGALAAEVAAGVIEELVSRREGERFKAESVRRRRERIERVLRLEDPLSMVFQPIWRLDEQQVVAAEALSRFRGPPERGPDVWFAEAKEVGLGIELELLAARNALDALPALPHSVELAVNASPSAACSSQFRELVGGVDAERVVVEITEHAAVDDYDEMSHALGELRAVGVQIAVDDAGAGFASLRHILRLDPQFIKLDRTLIEGIESDRSRQALAAGLISFGEKTGAAIIAEGIERQEELDSLRELGVRLGQGYFLARPGPLPLPFATSSVH
jgi:EAL domain-containing protein (putative c-di-GMP-specific phosphodiesterase class I)